MDIKITDKALRHFLETPTTPEELSQKISLCGPTFDRVTKTNSDYLYEIEIITNRIDTASAQGVARDSNAVLNQMGIKSAMINDPYQEKINLYPNLPKTFSFDIRDNTLNRLVAVSLERISIKESPEETKALLTDCGQRPINNAVDITNELTLLYGIPSHIFDLDKLGIQKLTVRESLKGEEITTLDNQKNILRGGDIIIEDGAGRLVDLVGVMGGAVAEVDEHTKNILLIIPICIPSKVRKTSLYLQKRTIAAQILEKQPDSMLALPVLTKAIKLFEDRAGARVSSSIFDSKPNPYQEKTIELDTVWANNLIGITIPTKNIISILQSLGFVVKEKDNTVLICTVPSWRYFDINIKEDLVEEIARVYGYSKLPPTLPCVNLLPEPKNLLLKTEAKIKNFLSCQGFNEIYNNSLVSEDLLTKCELQPGKHLKLTNALSKDFEYLRSSLVPSILQNIKNNQGKTDEPFNLFEVSNTYHQTEEKLPQEISNTVITSTNSFRQTKGVLESLFLHLNLGPFKFKNTKSAPIYYQNDSTAEIQVDKKTVGFIGLIKPSILHKIGISSNPTVVEIDTEILATSVLGNYVFKPISEFPEIIEQITISSTQPVGDIIEKIETVSPLINTIIYSESYKNNHTFRITFSSPKNNLTQTEVNNIKKSIQTLFN